MEQKQKHWDLISNTLLKSLSKMTNYKRKYKWQIVIPNIPFHFIQTFIVIYDKKKYGDSIFKLGWQKNGTQFNTAATEYGLPTKAFDDIFNHGRQTKFKNGWHLTTFYLHNVNIKYIAASNKLFINGNFKHRNFGSAGVQHV